MINAKECGMMDLWLIVFGEEYTMLKLCGIGVAMGNAIQEVKETANAIKISNEEDDVAAYLEKWMI